MWKYVGFCAGSGYPHYDAHDGDRYLGGGDVEAAVNCYGNHARRGTAQYAGGYFWRPQLTDADYYAEFRAVYEGAVDKRRPPLPSPLRRARAVFFGQAVQYIRQLQAWSAGRKAYKHRTSRGRDARGDTAGVAAHGHPHLP